MRKFIHNVTIFGIILLLMNVAIEFLLFLRPNEYSYKRAYVEEHFNDISCLLLGNSHIDRALNPEILGEGVFNMAIAGKWPIYDAELAKKYVPQMNQLKVLVMPLDYPRFYFGREKDNPNVMRDKASLRRQGIYSQSTYKCMYYKYMGIRVDGFWYWSEMLNSELDYMKRFKKNDEKARGCDSLGYVVNKNSLKRKENWENWGLPKIVDTTIEANQEEQELLYTNYCTLAELAKNQGAKLVLLFTPHYKTYNDATNPVVLQEMVSFVDSLKQKYPNVEYYDYSKDKRFVDEDFSNANHLTYIGATKFSYIVRQEVLDKLYAMSN